MQKMWEARGIGAEDAKKLTKLLSKSQRAFVDTLIDEQTEEEALMKTADEGKSSIKHGIFTFISFLLLGFTPLFSYSIYVAVESHHTANSLGAGLSLGGSLLLSLIVLMTLGVLKAQILQKSVARTTVITICFTVVSAVVGFFIGFALENTYGIRS